MNHRLLTAAGILLATAMMGGAADGIEYRTAWTRQFGTEGDDICNAVAVDRGDNIVVSGITRWTWSGNGTLSDAFVAKYDPNGKCLWSEVLGSDQCDEALALALDPADNIYVTGYTLGVLGEQSYGRNDFFLAKYDPNGTRVWIRQYGSPLIDRCSHIATDGNDIYLGGETQGDFGRWCMGGFDVLLVKYHADGELVWVREFGTNMNEWSGPLVADKTHHIYFAPHSLGDLVDENLGNDDLFLMNYDSQGTRCWVKPWATKYIETATCITLDPNQNVLLAVETTDALVHPGWFDALLIQYDPNGTVLWSQKIGTATDDSPAFVGVDPNRGIVLVGDTKGDLAGTNAGGATETNDNFLALFDSRGNLLYTRQWGTSDNDLAQAGALDSHGNVYIVGNTNGPLAGAPAQKMDGYLLKLVPSD